MFNDGIWLKRTRPTVHVSLTIMDHLMKFCTDEWNRVGFSVEEEYTTQLPVIPDELYDTDTVIVVDSKMGPVRIFHYCIWSVPNGICKK